MQLPTSARRGLLATAMLASLAACGSSWKVVRQAPASQLFARTEVVVSPCDFSRLSVAGVPEEKALTGAPEGVKRRWNLIKTDINSEFGKAFADRAQGYTVRFSGQGLTVKPFVDFVDPGCETGFCSSTLRATVQILAPDGAVLDEVLFESKHAGSIVEPTSDLRLRVDGRNLGWDVADYLNQRISGK